MFVHEHKNGVAIHQRRNGKETLVQWENGNQRWVETEDLQGTVRLIGSESVHEEY